MDKGKRSAEHMAGMVVSTRVKPGRENAYREWQDRIDAEVARFSGFLGNNVSNTGTYGNHGGKVLASALGNAKHIVMLLRVAAQYR